MNDIEILTSKMITQSLHFGCGESNPELHMQSAMNING